MGKVINPDSKIHQLKLQNHGMFWPLVFNCLADEEGKRLRYKPKRYVKIRWLKVIPLPHSQEKLRALVVLKSPQGFSVMSHLGSNIDRVAWGGENKEFFITFGSRLLILKLRLHVLLATNPPQRYSQKRQPKRITTPITRRYNKLHRIPLAPAHTPKHLAGILAELQQPLTVADGSADMSYLALKSAGTAKFRFNPKMTSAKREP
ncbi:hypothetical protein PoB_006976300 [Plakobranchus ocellatus]|uniref:Uncharacterized protein n=1 Tax=Plakobranchus ocellatus TaxID=259542 RepID=A0AAV4DGC3_9GAST|nr:hypothetical protein PoB_006976300 [Plakobranchus ocellatus]